MNPNIVQQNDVADQDLLEDKWRLWKKW